MQTVDFSSIIVGYNFIIGVLVMLSSEKVAAVAGCWNKAHGARIARLTRVSTFAFGACVAAFSASVYVLFHFFQFGV